MSRPWKAGAPLLAAGKQQVPTVCLLAGADGWTKERLVARLREAAVETEWRDSATESVWADEVAEAAVVDSAMTPPFGAPRKAVVVRRVESWRPGGAKKKGRGRKSKAAVDPPSPLLQYLHDPSPTTALILVSEKWEPEKWEADELGKLVEVLGDRGACVECVPPKGQAMATWLEGEAAIMGNTLDRAAAMELVERAGEGTLLLHSELEKLAVHAGRGGRITMEGVRELTGEQVLPNIFQFLDVLFVERRPGRALAMLARLMTEEHPLKLHTMMLNHLKKLLALKAAMAGGMSPGSAASRANVPYWLAERLGMMVQRTPRERFARLLGALADSETALKRGGDGRVVMETFVLKVCR